MNQFQVFPAAYEFQLDLVDILADDLTLHLAGNGFLKGGKVGLEQFFSNEVLRSFMVYGG